MREWSGCGESGDDESKCFFGLTATGRMCDGLVVWLALRFSRSSQVKAMRSELKVADVCERFGHRLTKTRLSVKPLA